MSLQSTAVLATSPLHDGSGDGSSSEETYAPSPPPLDAVVISITLGDLAFFVLHLACSAPPLRCRLVPVENRLLRERRLGQNKVGALQLQRQEGIKVNRRRRPPRRSASQQKRTRCIEKIRTHNFFVPAWGASGAAETAATSTSTSRSPAPHGAGPRAATGATVRSRSPHRRAGRPSSRKGEAATSGEARLLEHDIARLLPQR
jgi:hypothetical protein